MQTLKAKNSVKEAEITARQENSGSQEILRSKGIR